MKLIAYLAEGHHVDIRPAPLERAWMSATDQRFAYRCLPLNIANAHGWELLSPAAFSACWNGGAEPGAIDIRSDAEPLLQPTSLFGHGVLTFHLHGIFRTEPGWNLFVTGPVNRPKDGIAALSGVIETDWAPYTFTMNWKFTRARHWVSFEAGEPFCFLFPVQRGVLDGVAAEVRDIADDPSLKADYERWSRERTSFGDRLNVTGSPEQKERWQKRYYRGMNMQDRPGAPDHQIKLRLPEFADRRSPAMRSTPGAGPLGLPPFFRKIAPLSRLAHAELGLQEGDYGFAASTPLVPLGISELAPAARHYPIVFAAMNPPRPLCVLGAMADSNLHVDASGHWRAGAYIPAAARRYPFITIVSKDNADTLILGIDETATQLSPSAPSKLFDRGEMTALCRERLEFCSRVSAALRQADDFGTTLSQSGLLMPLRNAAPARIATRSCMEGLRTIDPARLASLLDATREAWRANGWLAAIEAQIASSRHWNGLLNLDDAMSARMAGETASPAG
jgi:hypothetical protein